MGYKIERKKSSYLLVERNATGKVVAEAVLPTEAYRALSRSARLAVKTKGKTYKGIMNADLQGLFGGLDCLVWKTNPLYWQFVAALKVARNKKLIKSKKACKSLVKNSSKASQLLSLPGLFTTIIKSGGKCACEQVF